MSTYILHHITIILPLQPAFDPAGGAMASFVLGAAFPTTWGAACESKTHHLVTISSILNCLKTCFNAVLRSAQNSSQPQHNKQHEDFLTKRMTRLASTWIYQHPFEELVQIHRIHSYPKAKPTSHGYQL